MDVTSTAESILHAIDPALTIGGLRLNGAPPNLRSITRAVITELDPTCSTSWVAFAGENSLRNYLDLGTVPTGVGGRVPTVRTTAPAPGAIGTTPAITPAAFEPLIERHVKTAVAAVESGLRADMEETLDKIKGSTATATATPATLSEISDMKARIDTIAGTVLEAVDTAKAVADEAARKAAAAAESVAKASIASATGMAPADVEKMIKDALRTLRAEDAKPIIPGTTTGTPATPSGTPVKPALSGNPDKTTDKTTGTTTGTTTTDEADHVTEMLRTFATPGAAHKPVLVKGEAGAGKTYATRQHGRLFDKFVEVQLNAQTEAADLLGYSRVDGGWQDGPLSQAFRAAANGYTVLILLDEYYRPQNQARSVLFTCTTPMVDAAGREFYVLTTGRAIPHPTEPDVYEPEVLYAPVSLLAIVGTTNVGAQYDVSVGDPAEKRRFAPVHVDVTEAILRRVLGSVVASPSHPLFAVREKLVNGAAAFWNLCRALKRNDQIEIVPTVSTFCEAAKHPAAHDIPTFVKLLTLLGQHVWVGEDLDGQPVSEQLAAVHAALATSFPAE